MTTKAMNCFQQSEDYSMAKKTMTLEHIDYSISRWKTRLKRAMTTLDKLEKQRKRVEQRGRQAGVPSLPPAPRAPVPFPNQGDGIGLTKPAPAPPVAVPKTGAQVADEEIPAFLRRSEPSPPTSRRRRVRSRTCAPTCPLASPRW